MWYMYISGSKAHTRLIQHNRNVFFKGSYKAHTAQQECFFLCNVLLGTSHYVLSLPSFCWSSITSVEAYGHPCVVESSITPQVDSCGVAETAGVFIIIQDINWVYLYIDVPLILFYHHLTYLSWYL